MRRVVRRSRDRWVGLAPSAAALGLCACAGPEHPPAFDTLRSDVRASPRPASLVAPTSCDDLLFHIHQRLIDDVLRRAERARLPPEAYSPAASANGLVAKSATGAAAGPPQEPSSAFSRNTVLEPGVKEGAFSEAEGDLLYLLDEQGLHVIHAWPPRAMQTTALVPIEGYPAELLVHDGLVAVFSFPGGAVPGSEDLYTYPNYSPWFTKLTLIDARGGAPSVLREHYFEGSYGGSRLSESTLRFTVGGSYKVSIQDPIISYVDTFGRPRRQADIDRQLDAWVLLARDTIEDSTLDTYLPLTLEVVDGQSVQRSLECERHLVPPVMYYPAATTLVEVDLEAPAAPLERRSVLGYWESVVLEHGLATLSQNHVDEGPGRPRSWEAELHVVPFDAAVAPASGRFPGYPASTPYALDELEGVLRVALHAPATTPAGAAETLQVPELLTLSIDGTELGELGRTPLGAPGDSLFAARFDRHRAYLLSTPGEPANLLTVDLADPASPTAPGKLERMQLTNILMPLPGDQLLTVGRESFDTPSEWVPDTARVVAQWIDASDPGAPRFLGEQAYGPGTSAAATYGHSGVISHPTEPLFAFTLSEAYGPDALELLRLSPGVGLVPAGHIVPTAPGVTITACLEVMGLPSGPDAVAAVEAEPTRLAETLDACHDYFSRPQIRGALLREHYVLLITTATLAAFDLNALGPLPVAELRLTSGQ